MTANLSLLAFLTNLLLPKGGFYLGEIPITWGYILLGIAAVAVLGRILRASYRPSRPEWIAAVALMVFFLFSTTGIVATTSAGPEALLSYLISVSVVPIAAVLVGGYTLSCVPAAVLRSSFLWVAVVIAGWGIIHFVLMNFFDAFVGIPYLTVTGGELDIANSRSINRNGVFKLVSTYNNGNIYGINVLMWFPLVLALATRTRSTIPAGAASFLRASLLFTISRTVWAGWLVAELLYRAFVVRRIRSVLVTSLLLPLIFAAAALFSAFWFGDPFTFIFDQDLGGRRGQFEQRFEIVTLSFHGIQEVVYTSMLANFGLLGLLLFLAVWGFPLLLPTRGRVGRAAKAGLVTYLFVMISDGAFGLVPTQFTYWMVASFVLTGVGDGVLADARSGAARAESGAPATDRGSAPGDDPRGAPRSAP